MQTEEKRKEEQEKFSISVTNAPTFCQLIEPVDVWPSGRIHVKHENELLTVHLLKWNKILRLYVRTPSDVWGTLHIHCGETVVEGPLFCHSSLKFQDSYANVLLCEFKWRSWAGRRLMDSSHNRWGRTSHQEPRISSRVLNLSLCRPFCCCWKWDYWETICESTICLP